MRSGLVAALCGAVLIVAASPAFAAPPGRNGKIVATRWKTVEGMKRPRADIVVMNRNGRKLRQLTMSGKAWNPAVSPDGRTVAYICGNHGHASQICLKPISGGKEKVLRGLSGYHKVGVAWSPGGRWIAYGAYESGEPAAVYKVRRSGKDAGMVWAASGSQYVWSISGLSWSPDGKTIAFENVNFDDQSSEIWGVGPDGAGAHPIVRGRKWAARPDYSPDGLRLMFGAYPDGKVGQILHTDTNGEDEKQVTSGAKDAHSPVFSPNGAKFLFVRNGSLFKRNLDGSGLQKIRSRTKRTAFGRSSWQPR